MSKERILSGGVDDPVRHDNPFIEHVSQAKQGMKVLPERLYVICPIYNPRRWISRLNLFRSFEKHVQESGAKLIVIEVAFGSRPFEITSSTNPDHIQLRTEFEMWYKENMVNVALLHIFRHYPDAEKVAWIDGDMKIIREDWVQETLQLLEHHQFLQLWSQIQNVSPDYEIIGQSYSYFHNWCNGRPPIPIANKKDAHIYESYPYPSKDLKTWYGPPGGAWAARREALNAVGGLMDWNIVGGGDSYMAAGLIGGIEFHMNKHFSVDFKRMGLRWQEMAIRHIRKNVGYMPGLMIHFWHGNKKRRVYSGREEILIKNTFNPFEDLKRDTQGLWQLVDDGTERGIKLRDGIVNYFKGRNEDSTDVIS